MLSDVPSHSVHQMCLPEPDSAIKKQRIERHWVARTRASLGDAARRGVGELVGLANDEILEDEALIESQELRLVVTDFERQYRSGGTGQARRSFHSIIRPGDTSAVCLPRRHADDDQ